MRHQEYKLKNITNMKTFRSILLAGAMLLAMSAFFSSCQEDGVKLKYKMEVTVINDFTEVVEAINKGSLKNEQAIVQLVGAINKMNTDQQTKLQAILDAIISEKNTLDAKLAVIEAAIKAQTIAIDGKLALIEQVLKSQNTTMETKLGAIEAAIKAQTIAVGKKMELVQSILSDVNNTLEVKLGAIETTMKEQSIEMGKKLTLIETAMKDQKTTFEEKMELLTAAFTNIPDYTEKFDAIITAINAINPDEQLKAIEDVMTKFKDQSLEQSLYLENLYKKITADDGKNSRLKAIEAAILAMSDYGGKIDGIKQEILDLIKAVNDGTSSVEDAWAEIGTKIDELKGETGGGSGSGTTDDSVPIPYDVVDLGLPSGLLWSKWNLGGKAVGDAGDYYAWGELEPKTEFTKRNYRFFNEDPVHYSKYNDMDKLYMLQSEDDVATQKLGKWYRLPSDDDWQELLDNCTWEPITTTVLTETIVAGWKVKGKNGNEIVLPSTGYYDKGSELRMTFTFYQSSTIHVDYNYYTINGIMGWTNATKKTGDGGVEITRPKAKEEPGIFRYSGTPVRPVCDIK